MTKRREVPGIHPYDGLAGGRDALGRRRDQESGTLSYKSIPVRLRRSAVPA